MQGLKIPICVSVLGSQLRYWGTKEKRKSSYIAAVSVQLQIIPGITFSWDNLKTEFDFFQIQLPLTAPGFCCPDCALLLGRERTSESFECLWFTISSLEFFLATPFPSFLEMEVLWSFAFLKRKDLSFQVPKCCWLYYLIVSVSPNSPVWNKQFQLHTFFGEGLCGFCLLLFFWHVLCLQKTQRWVQGV